MALRLCSVGRRRRRMMGELRVRVPYCVESCEVPKQRSAAQRTVRVWV